MNKLERHEARVKVAWARLAAEYNAANRIYEASVGATEKRYQEAIEQSRLQMEREPNDKD